MDPVKHGLASVFHANVDGSSDLPYATNKAYPTCRQPDARRLRSTHTRMAVGSLLFFACILAWLSWTGRVRCMGPYRALRDEALVKGTTPHLDLPKSLMRRWGQYAPWMPARPYEAPPEGCVVSQVNLLQRHGARYPTEGSGRQYQAAVDKLLAVDEYKADELQFLNDFKYNMGTDDLIPFGAAQSFDSAGSDFYRYSHLVKKDCVPFVRSSGAPRVVDTAENWTAGFYHASGKKVEPVVNLIIPEADSNNTLDDVMCPNSKSTDGDEQSDQWRDIFAPKITKRLNAAAPGANLTDRDMISLMSMCPFHTLVTEKPSPFCFLFSEDEFDDYQYYNDLNKFYGNGYGAPLGPVQGVGYVNELLARLTNTTVHDHTQTNHTLDADPATFPLGLPFYADFSHDNELNSIYAALGLFPQTLLPGHLLDPRAKSALRSFVLSRLVPFSARMVVERVVCEGAGAGGPYVRVVVNDAVLPLTVCAGEKGMCTLDDFVASQRYARENGQGDWEKCFEEAEGI